MDITGLDAVCDHPVAKGKQLEEFTKKYNMLSKEEIKNSFEASCKDLLSILGQAVPCIGCRRRSVYQLELFDKFEIRRFIQFVNT